MTYYIIGYILYLYLGSLKIKYLYQNFTCENQSKMIINMEGEFEEMAMSAMLDLGIPEDEAERMLEDYNFIIE